MTRTYVVRVVLEHHNKEQFNNPFLESLRYAGLVELHSDVCFDILPPHGVNSRVWAEQNAARMQSFRYNAVAAPAWGERS